MDLLILSIIPTNGAEEGEKLGEGETLWGGEGQGLLPATSLDVVRVS